MGWLITFCLVTVLAVLPIGLRFCYDSHGTVLRLLLGPAKITLYPGRNKKALPPEKAAQKKQQEKQQEPSLPKPPKAPKKKNATTVQNKGGSLTDFLPLVKIAIDFLGDFRRKLRIDNLYLRLILADSDPCDLAVNYGKTWAAIGNLLPVLETVFVIKKRDVEVQCDFQAVETLVIARVDMTITLGRILSLAAGYGWRLIKEFLKLRNKRKGGAIK